MLPISSTNDDIHCPHNSQATIPDARHITALFSNISHQPPFFLFFTSTWRSFSTVDKVTLLNATQLRSKATKTARVNKMAYSPRPCADTLSPCPENSLAPLCSSSLPSVVLKSPTPLLQHRRRTCSSCSSLAFHSVSPLLSPPGCSSGSAADFSTLL